jgi:hypothetical protein
MCFLIKYIGIVDYLLIIWGLVLIKQIWGMTSRMWWFKSGFNFLILTNVCTLLIQSRTIGKFNRL